MGLVRNALLTAALAIGGVPSAAQQAVPHPPAFVTALSTECADGGRTTVGTYQFVVTCPGTALSPDGRFAVVQDKPDGAIETGLVRLADGKGATVDELGVLGDAMPFTVAWSTRPGWFFANHYLGSSLERLRVFEIVNRTAIERSNLFAEATRVMVERYPCLGRHANVVGSGWHWSRDGKRIALVAYARPDACLEEFGPNDWRPVGDWQPLWMIGDAETGRIDPASVRVRKDGAPFPKEGPYARF